MAAWRIAAGYGRNYYRPGLGLAAGAVVGGAIAASQPTNDYGGYGYGDALAYRGGLYGRGYYRPGLAAGAVAGGAIAASQPSSDYGGYGDGGAHASGYGYEFRLLLWVGQRLRRRLLVGR